MIFRRLAHLLHAHAEAVVVVPDAAHRHVEVELLVAAVGHGLAQVPRVSGGAQERSGHAQLQEPLLGDDAGALRALQPDLVAVEQRHVLVDAGAHHLAELTRLLLEAGRDVLHHAADLEVARVDALAAGHLEQVERQVAVAAAPPEHRDGAEVERSGGDPEQVRGHPVELEVDHAQELGARRHLLPEQLLHRHAEGHRVEVVGEVVHPLDERDRLPVLLVLAALLDAGVDVADDRLDVAHHLALERGQQPQDPVGGGVVRADVDREELVAPAQVGLGHRLRAGHRRLAQPLHRHRALALAVGDLQRGGAGVGGRLASVSHTSAGTCPR